MVVFGFSPSLSQYCTVICSWQVASTCVYTDIYNMYSFIFLFNSQTHIYIYIIFFTFHNYRRYSGIISNRRCISGVWQKPFQIEDITECKSSSNDQKSKNKSFNLGMIFAISSIWKSFVKLPFLVVFVGKLYKINRTWTPGCGWPLDGGSAKVPPEMGPGRRYFCTPAI